jgi:hypothetical protein
MKLFFFFFLHLICFTSCGKKLPGRPVNYSIFEKKAFKEDVYYPIQNIDVLKDGKRRVDAAMLKRGMEVKSKSDYVIVSGYVSDYNKILQGGQPVQIVDEQSGIAKSVFSILKKKQDYTKINNYKKYPEMNSEAVQYLKYKKNKIAIPPYMVDYMYIYYSNLPKEEVKIVESKFAKGVDDMMRYDGSFRDKFVQSKLAWYDIYNTENKTKFEEKSFVAIE